MSESSSEKPDTGLIPDEDLPEDLQAEENPLARDPDDESADGDGAGPGSEPKVDGLPDAGDAG